MFSWGIMLTRLKILTVIDIFICDLRIYIYQHNHKYYRRDKNVHGFYTRGRDNFRLLECKWDVRQRSLDFLKPRIYDKLLMDIRGAPTEPAFIKTLRTSYLLQEGFYTLEQFFSSGSL